MTHFRLKLFRSDDVCVFDEVVAGHEKADTTAPEGVVLVVEADGAARTRPLFDAQPDRKLRAEWTPAEPPAAGRP